MTQYAHSKQLSSLGIDCSKNPDQASIDKGNSIVSNHEQVIHDLYGYTPVFGSDQKGIVLGLKMVMS